MSSIALNASRRADASLPWTVCLAIFGVALLIRLVVLAMTGPRLGGDSTGYVSAAGSVASGGLPAALGLPLERAPLYSVFLVPGVLLPIDAFWYAAVAQAIVGALTVVLIARVAGHGTGSDMVGVLAGVIATVHLGFLFWGVYVLSDTLFLFTLALSLDRLMVLPHTRRPVLDAAVAGICVAVSVISRPTALPFAAGLVVYVVAISGGSVTRFLRLSIGLVTPVLLAVAIWALVATAGRVPSPVASAERAAAWARSAVALGLVWTEEGRATFGVDVGVQPPPILREMTPAEQADFVRLEAEQHPFEFIAAQPGFFIEQAARKFRMFWAPALPEYSLTHALINVAYYVPFYVLAVAGLADAMRRHRALAVLLTLGVVTFLGTCLLTFVDYDQRYRLPVEMLLIPLVAVGLSWMVARRSAPNRLARIATAPR